MSRPSGHHIRETIAGITVIKATTGISVMKHNMGITFIKAGTGITVIETDMDPTNITVTKVTLDSHGDIIIITESRQSQTSQ
jgi:hypothetical protein